MGDYMNITFGVKLKAKSKTGLEKMKKELDWIMHQIEQGNTKYIKKLENWLRSHENAIPYLDGLPVDRDRFLAFLKENSTIKKKDGD